MQKAKDLEGYFGRLCLIQFREAVALAVPDRREPVAEPVQSSGGDRTLKAGIGPEGIALIHQKYWPTNIIGIGTAPEKDVQSFTLTMQGRLFTAPASEHRVLVAYEVAAPGGMYIAEMSVAVSDIYAITTIDSRRVDESRLITPGSS
jgi:hypothetical protein